MKYIRIVTLILLLPLILISCGDDKGANDTPQNYEIAMISECSDIAKDSFSSTTWTAIQNFCEEYEMTGNHYELSIESDATDAEIVRESDKVVEKAIEEGAKAIIFAGSIFETSAESAQNKYEDTYFVLIDGVPRDDKHNYELAANSTGVLFAEEQSGYLAGYAAVADGYTKLGFIGGDELPPVKRYGYGFLQGISDAVKDTGAKGVELKYAFTGTFKEDVGIEDGALKWYKDGTQVIFACGGSIGSSVVKAAEKTGGEDEHTGRVIGVDTDQSSLSDTVITSAKKEIKTAIYDILKTYIHGNFKGNSVFNYNLENNGISLEMTNSRFASFNRSDYSQLTDRIKNNEVTIDKEIGDKKLKDLGDENVSVTKDDII